MEKIIKNLSEKSILQRNQVREIKQYIDTKYDGAPTHIKANVFANAVHQIVDESVTRFEKKHRVQIKTEVVKSAIAKDIFEINGYDIFEVCSTLPLEDDTNIQEDFFSSLTDWVNENQEEQVTVEDTKSMASTIIDKAVSSMVDMLEETILIDKDIINLNHHEQDVLSIDNAILNIEENDLEENITDGRFMQTEGDIIDLTTKDIEEALKNEIPKKDGLGFYEKVIQDDKPIIKESIADSLKKKLAEKYDDIDVEEEAEIFDSMDMFLDDETNKNSPKEQEEMDGGSLDDDHWDQVHLLPHKKVETTRLGGFDISKSKKQEEAEGERMAMNIRLLLLIPIVLIMVMLLIVLIIGAVQISKQSTSNEMDYDSDLAVTLSVEYDNNLNIVEDSADTKFELQSEDSSVDLYP